MIDESAPIMEEISLVDLPGELSEAIDVAVVLFVNENNKEQDLKKGLSSPVAHLPDPDNDPPGVFRAYRRWHGADLWIVFSDAEDDQPKGKVTHRVTIGVYSDARDKLIFIPDIVVTKPSGRYVLPLQAQDTVESRDLYLSVRELEEAIFSYGKRNGDLRNRITRKLTEAWRYAMEIPPSDATELLP